MFREGDFLKTAAPVVVEPVLGILGKKKTTTTLQTNNQAHI